VRIPVIEMVEIGAGGGSLAHVDVMGRIAVGPESAGADPGPACYGRGGTEPAVTDANLVLGRYDPARFAGGTMRLHETAAHDALAARVGSRLGLPAEMAASASSMVDENMANAARVPRSSPARPARPPDRVWWWRAAHACRVAEGRHLACPGAVGRRRRQCDRLPAGTGRL
jgi:N-methylhydantoinase A